MTRYLQETARSRDSKRAMSTTIGAIGHACFGTASTTAAGLVALYVSKTRMLAEFGIVGGIGVMVSYLDTIVFLPAMLQSFTPPAHLLQAEVKKDSSPSRARHHSLDHHAAHPAAPKLVLALSILLTLGSAYTARQLRVDSALLDQFKTDDPMYISTRLLEQNFEGVRPLEVSLSSSERRASSSLARSSPWRRVTTWLNKRPEVLSATDPSMPFVQVWSAFTGTQATPRRGPAHRARARGARLRARQA